MRLGKKPVKYDSRTLRFAKYLVPSKLPPLPSKLDHYSQITNWPMDGNDTKGDCVLAACAHQIQQWTKYATGVENAPSESQVVALYNQMSPYDDGLVILDTLNIWRKTGLWNHKIDAYARLDIGHLEQAKWGILIFGAVQIGMSLPDQQTYGPWTSLDGPPDIYQGHDVILVGWDDSTKMFKAVTWGEVVYLSYAWYQYYSDESYAILSREWVGLDGRSYEGYDWATMTKDLVDVTQNDPPIDPPAPVPPPNPTPSHNWLYVVIGAVVLAIGAVLSYIFK